MPERPDEKPEEKPDEHHNLWNKREPRSVLPQLILLTLLCMVLAYLLSKSFT